MIIPGKLYVYVGEQHRWLFSEPATISIPIWDDLFNTDSPVDQRILVTVIELGEQDTMQCRWVKVAA